MPGPRRRPFLIRALENTLVKLIMSLEFYDEAGRQKIAIGERASPTTLSGSDTRIHGWVSPPHLHVVDNVGHLRP